MARWILVVAIAVATAAAGCVSEDDSIVSADTSNVMDTSTTTTSTTPTTTASETRTTTTTAITTTAPPSLASVPPKPPALLLAGPDGIALAHASGRIEPIWTGQPIAAAYPDYDGGVIFQEAGWPREPIYQLRAGARAPEMLVPSAPRAWPELHNVEVIDGLPTMVYVVERFLCSPDGDCYTDMGVLNIEFDLMFTDLVTGETRKITTMGDWESIPLSSSVGGAHVVHEWGDEGEWGHFRLADLEGNWVPAPVDPCGPNELSCTATALSPDGGHLAVIGQPCSQDSARCLPQLRVLDATDRTEAARATIEGGSATNIDADEHRVAVAGIGVAYVFNYLAELEHRVDLDSFAMSSIAIWPEEPPQLEVIDPAHGDTVTTRRYTFTGTTCPGCTVMVGDKYDATIEPDGVWALELLLEPGRNSTTFVARDPATGLESAASLRVSYAPALELRPDGLGPVDFGVPADTAVATLTSLLGAPSTDVTSHRVEVGAPIGGACLGGFACNEFVRLVTWDTMGLGVVVSDSWGDWPSPVVPMTFAGYGYSGGEIIVAATSEGITIGSTVRDLRTAYGDELQTSVDEDCIGSAVFSIQSQEHDTPYGGFGYWGTLSEGPARPSSIVTSISAGAPSSC